ncbi:hypothetical protein QJS66_02340 [Kocuria rhizophila]|nr:hypothetical protein QJS66_02340 [Kocuria rhizophila]
MPSLTHVRGKSSAAQYCKAKDGTVGVRGAFSGEWRELPAHPRTWTPAAQFTAHDAQADPPMNLLIWILIAAALGPVLTATAMVLLLNPHRARRAPSRGARERVACSTSSRGGNHDRPAAPAPTAATATRPPRRPARSAISSAAPGPASSTTTTPARTTAFTTTRPPPLRSPPPPRPSRRRPWRSRVARCSPGVRTRTWTASCFRHGHRGGVALSTRFWMTVDQLRQAQEVIAAHPQLTASLRAGWRRRRETAGGVTAERGRNTTRGSSRTRSWAGRSP